jgi:O-antigen/teichoic acid export membrane protein
VFSVTGYFLDIFSDWRILLALNLLGVGALITNWLTNTLIGSSDYRRLNLANIISVTASLISLVVVKYFGLNGALLSLLIQPILFTGVIFFTGRKEIPTKFDLDIKHIKYILSFGFIPFLSGVFFLVYQQIERWSVGIFLGPEALGKMYLIFLTTTLWVLVPSSILNLFFPKAIKFYNDNDLVNFNKVVRSNFLITIGYCVILTLIGLIIFNPLVGLIFPQHQPYVYLVILGLPGLIFRILCDPISLYLNSIVKLSPIFWSDVISLCVYISCLILIFNYNLFVIDYFIISFNVYFLIKFIYLFLIFIKIRNSIT